MSDTPVAPAAGRLAFSQKLAFGAQSLSGAAMGILLAVYMGKFYVDVVLLPAGLYALVVAAGRALDAITDPMMGWISDHTSSRWGRRKPYILLGMLGNAVAFYLMLTPGAELSTAEVLWWFLATYLTSFVFVTMVNVPRQALGAELTSDAAERVSLFGLVSVFAALGLIAGAIMPAVLTEGGGMTDPRLRMGTMARVYVGAYVLLNLFLLLRLRERAEYQGRGKAPFVPGVRRAIRNRPFVIMFVSHVVTAIPVLIPATLMPFFVEYVLQAGERWTGILILTYLLSGLLALPLWIALARRHGKLRVWLINGFIGVTGGALMFLAGPGDTTYVLCVEAYVGMQSQVWLVLGSAMHADVIDYDELLTGKRREAQFSALFAVIPKFALIPGAAVPLAILGGVGYVPNEPQQAPEVVAALSALFALVPAACNGLGVAIMWWYPLSEARHAAIREGVQRHAAGQDAVDPLTGRTLPPPGRRGVDEDTGWFLDHFSRGELRAYADGGRSPLPRVLGAAGACLALTLGAVALATQLVGDLSEEPGAGPVLAIVGAGLSLAALIFQLLRVRPAVQLQHEPVASDVVRRHLE
jgi:GPH family glycoside/pentoside/hexuronide:cation symporter